MKLQLKGCWASKRVWVDGNPITASRSQQVINHSPDGFNWGYGGSGPAQLSLGIALELWSERTALDRYHQIMLIVANLPQESFDKTIEI